MSRHSKWVTTIAAALFLAGTAAASEATSAGTVKLINSDKKEFVLSDSAGKDWTINFAPDVVINRSGKETQTDLKVGDKVDVFYDKGLLTWTARYILVQEGDAKNCALAQGTVKSYSVEDKQISFTDEHGQPRSYPMGTAKVRLNRVDAKVEAIKIGDRVLAIVQKAGDNENLMSLMIERK